MTVSANGALASQDPTSGCDVNGHISIINASFNAYSLSATYSNCQGNASILNGVTATGLLTLDDTVSPNVLYAGYSVTLSNGAFIIVVADDTRSSGGSVPNASPGGIVSFR
jgi:hypothetical protein